MNYLDVECLCSSDIRIEGYRPGNDNICTQFKFTESRIFCKSAAFA